MPVRVRECKPGGLLKALNYIDLVDLDEEAAKSALLNGVKLGSSQAQLSTTFSKLAFHAARKAHARAFPESLPPVWNVPQMS